MPELRFKFDRHGLGDICHAALAVQLYKRREYDVTVQVEENKKFLWNMAGVNIVQGGDLPDHGFGYPSEFDNLDYPDAEKNKMAFGLRDSVMPQLDGTSEEIWDELCAVRLSAKEFVSQAAHDEAETFLSGLPRPIICLHSRGTNWHERKSLPTETAFELIRTLLDQMTGSVVVLDYDGRAPMVGHARCRGIKPSWGHIDVERLCALYEQCDLMIGVDSGPFHVASFTDIKALGVFRSLHPTRVCLPNPNAVYLCSRRYHDHWERRRNKWNIMEYSGGEPTVDEIAMCALQILKEKTTIIKGASKLTTRLVHGGYLYRRVGHDERRLEFLEDGSIGEGAADCEKVWKVEQTPLGDVITIYGLFGGPTCHLRLDSDGIYRGHWLNYEKMPIELIPENPIKGHPSDLVDDWPETFCVGIPTLFRHDLLEKCIESILRGSALPKAIYIIDNTEGTRMAAWKGHPSKRVKIIRGTGNIGVAASWNVLHSLCQPVPLIIANDDVELGFNLCEKMLADPAEFVSASSIQMFCVFLLRSDARKKVGHFDEEFWPAYHEDNDYGHRMAIAQVVTSCPESDGYRDNGPSATKAMFNSGEIDHFNKCFDRCRAYYIRKWGGPPHMETFKVPFGEAPDVSPV